MPSFTSSLVVYHPDDAGLARALARQLQIPAVPFLVHHFPDGESQVRVVGKMKHRRVILVMRLDHPDAKLFPLMAVASACRGQGAKKVTLVCPYLPYMRQDKAFHPGEAVSARVFASAVSQVVDELITIDPHLHRIKRLGEVYSVPTHVLSATPLIADYVASRVSRALVIGPDAESRQWVSQISVLAQVPFVVLHKKRLGDRRVRITWPKAVIDPRQTLVLADDIVSSGATLLLTLKHLRQKGFKKIVCLLVHALCTKETVKKLKAAGATKIVSTNTVPHPTNGMDVVPLLTAVLRKN